MKLGEAARRIREEHEAETAQYRVEDAIVEAERLAVRDHDRGVR